MKYQKIDVSEQQLEDLVRTHVDHIEDGLVYLDHQKQTDTGRLDVLLADSGKALVLAELKVIEDDGMLLQGLDYYDYLSRHIEKYARTYKDAGVDPTQEPRMLLVAPSFSQSLINRCKWIDVTISLFTYSCVRIDGSSDILPVFTEVKIPSPQVVVESVGINDHLNYITDDTVKKRVIGYIDEAKRWMPGKVSVDAVKVALSFKVNGSVFAYLLVRRKHYLVATYNQSDVWTEYPVHSEEDANQVKQLSRAAMERRAKD